MQRLFGIPMGDLAVGLSIALGLAIGIVAACALRNRFLLRLGLRNLTRRPGRAALIVAGLMLGTTIIASALVTGDTMNRTVRASVIESLGRTDELVSVRGTDREGAPALADVVERRLLRRRTPSRRSSARCGGPGWSTASRRRSSSPSRCRTRRAGAPRRACRCSPPTPRSSAASARSAAAGGETVSLADLKAGEVYLDGDAADALGARAGDRLSVLSDRRATPARVAAVVDYDGTGSDGAVRADAARGRTAPARARRPRSATCSSPTGATRPPGAELTGRVVAAAAPALAPLGLELQKAKQDGLEAADQLSDVFVSVFTTFGSFSIAAGILLIFLIFVMLSAERRSELGIARAIGTRREHLVQLFVFEGLAYDLGAALVGAALGVGVAFAMVTVMADAFDTTGLDVQQAVTLRSLVVAYALGVLLTLVVVAVSAWRVSRLNIVSAVRGTPEPPPRRRSRRHAVLAAAGLALGAALADVRPLGQPGDPVRGRGVARRHQPHPAGQGRRLLGAHRLHRRRRGPRDVVAAPVQDDERDRRAPPGHGLLGVVL